MSDDAPRTYGWFCGECGKSGVFTVEGRPLEAGDFYGRHREVSPDCGGGDTRMLPEIGGTPARWKHMLLEAELADAVWGGAEKDGEQELAITAWGRLADRKLLGPIERHIITAAARTIAALLKRKVALIKEQETEDQ